MGRKISDGGDRETPGSRRKRLEFFRPRNIDMVWLWELWPGDKFRIITVNDISGPDLKMVCSSFLNFSTGAP